jgi:hypothetical protein
LSSTLSTVRLIVGSSIETNPGSSMTFAIVRVDENALEIMIAYSIAFCEISDPSTATKIFLGAVKEFVFGGTLSKKNSHLVQYCRLDIDMVHFFHNR